MCVEARALTLVFVLAKEAMDTAGGQPVQVQAGRSLTPAPVPWLSFPPARMPQVDEAGIDMLLVGDSVAMVVHGHDTTLPITMDEMLTHCKAAARGASRAFLVGDMPFGSGAPRGGGCAGEGEGEDRLWACWRQSCSCMQASILSAAS